MSEADQRLALIFAMAASLHVLVLFGIVFPAAQTEEPATEPLTVTLSTMPEARSERGAEVLADADQAGPDDTAHHSRDASWTMGESILAHRYSRTLGTGEDAADTPLLARSDPDAARASGRGRRESDGRAGRATHREPTPVLRRAAVADPRAAYLEKWRQTVERAGSRAFPHAILAGARGERRLTLAVTLAADGSLVATRVIRGSGNPELDAAARRILRDSAPFRPFPPELRDRWPRLTFAYDWRFLPGRDGTVDVGAR